VSNPRDDPGTLWLKFVKTDTDTVRLLSMWQIDGLGDTHRLWPRDNSVIVSEGALWVCLCHSVSVCVGGLWMALVHLCHSSTVCRWVVDAAAVERRPARAVSDMSVCQVIVGGAAAS
jgi:hypothetical protein